MSTILVTAALEYIELKTIIAILVVVICGILSFQISARRPLYYNLFVVEMHTWTTRRMVQVLHLGQEFRPHVPWDRLVQRIRARAPRVQGDQRLAISDTNIVIQSPTTVIDSPAPARSPGIDVLTMWDIEMPPPLLGQAPDATRDSQYAAAAAIAILARGDDASLISRIFRNDDRGRDESRDGPRHEFVTTDVTYTTPTINRSDLPHHITRNSDRSAGSVNENFVDHPNQNLGFQDDEQLEDISETDEENGETSEAGTSEPESTSADPPDRQLPEEERLAKLTREAEYAVIEGPSEGKVLIRLKFLSDIQKDTYASLEDTVAKFKVEHFTDLSNKVVRLIYQGQLLREDNRTLQDYGLQAGSVVHCHISMIPYTRPGMVSLPPMVDDSGARRRTRRFRGPTGEQIAPPDDLARRRAAQDRNVGHVYLLLSTMVPILSGIGLAFFRPDRIRDLLRPATLLTLSQWVCNLFGDTELLPDQNEEQDSPSHTFQLFFIFGGQLLAVTIFLYFFPDLFDRIGFSIFCIVLLYFVFVVYYSRQRRRQPADIDAQNDLIETQIVRETISLL